ncbi:hypothetical protein FS749_006550 [Ceratobasidium sp. UAMH 11750]|nr:hypothetical protein FS749_006550 [Ceratobasidium sp. UAMH 11750]
MIKEQEREVVDLTSDAEEDDMSAPVMAPALVGKPSAEKRPNSHASTWSADNAAPCSTASTPVLDSSSIQRQTSNSASTSPHQSGLLSPLFVQALTGDAYTQDRSSEGPSIPLDPPPSSPPPMSDSDLKAGSGVDADGKDGYREPARYTDGESSESGFGVVEGDVAGSDVDRQLDTETDFDDEDGGEWNETIRPPEPDPAEVESAAQDGALLDGLGDAQLDLDTLTNFLDMLGGVGAEMPGGPNPEQFGTDFDGILGQTMDHPAGTDLDPSALDFSWLDALGSSNPGEAGFEMGVEGSADLFGAESALAG